MTFAEIRQALETATRVPEAALSAAASHIAELTPPVIEMIGKVKAGVYLLPEQANLLLYGVHVLAAARAAALWPAWCDLLRQPGLEADIVFGGDNVIDVLTTVSAGLVGDDAPAIVGLLEAPDVSADVRWALFSVLARLVWEGRADLAGTKAFLERFAREPLAEPDDAAWQGWMDAVRLLGLVELTPLIEEVLAKPALAYFNDADRRETMERLAAAAADFADEGRFLQDRVAPLDDPVEGLWWLRSLQARDDQWLAELQDDEPPDPAADIALTVEEEAWLSGFLASAEAPAATMNLEVLDGFFCALVVGPEAVMPDEYLPYVWGAIQPAAGPIYDSPAQERFVLDLLARYRTTIERRIADGVGHDPFLFGGPDDVDIARDWAAGFLLGTALRDAAWEKMMRRRKTGMLVASIYALCPDTPGEAITPEMRRDIVDELPDILLDIADEARRAARLPRQSTKIGRNQPCPCGSGRKYKKCCGAAAPAAPG
jgi:uncharacterized protein